MELRQRAKNFSQGARLYYDCAIAADRDIGHRPGFEIHAPFPVMSLIAHSGELSLKSFLLSRGFEEIRRPKHNLVEAKRLCSEIGRDDQEAISKIDDDLLEVISDIHQNMTLRYGEPSKLGRLPVFGPMQRLCQHSLVLCEATIQENERGSA